jgi:molybdopterin synthase catalytic subunit
MEFCEIRITREPLNAGRLNFSPNEGAVVDFFGVVRAIENDRIIDGIEYDAFEAMAERQLVLVAEEARNQHRLGLVIIHHRIGYVRAGEASLFVRVTARHRRAAFDGSCQIVERLKQTVPIWKHPVYANAQIA